MVRHSLIDSYNMHRYVRKSRSSFAPLKAVPVHLDRLYGTGGSHTLRHVGLQVLQAEGEKGVCTAAHTVIT